MLSQYQNHDYNLHHHYIAVRFKIVIDLYVVDVRSNIVGHVITIVVTFIIYDGHVAAAAAFAISSAVQVVSVSAGI